MDPNADEATKWRRRAAEAKNYEKAAKQAKAAGKYRGRQADEKRRAQVLALRGSGSFMNHR